jgi:hypothetical protein
MELMKTIKSKCSINWRHFSHLKAHEHKQQILGKFSFHLYWQTWFHNCPKCDILVEGKFSGIHWLTQIKCPNVTQALLSIVIPNILPEQLWKHNSIRNILQLVGTRLFKCIQQKDLYSWQILIYYKHFPLYQCNATLKRPTVLFHIHVSLTRS